MNARPQTVDPVRRVPRPAFPSPTGSAAAKAPVSPRPQSPVPVPAPQPLSKEEEYQREVELINLHADELNKEAEDVHSYQEYGWALYGSPWDREP